MHLKSFAAALVLLVALCLPASAQTYDLNKFKGTYVSDASQDFVFVKRLTIEKQDYLPNGKVKFRATLSGFPDDIYLGEATGESYADRTTPVARSYLTTFSTGKLSVFMVIRTHMAAPQNVNGCRSLATTRE
jgi:hypothetical protein